MQRWMIAKGQRMASTNRNARGRRRWRPWAALLGLLALGTTGAVSAQEAPAHWMAYAASVSAELQQRLQQEQDVPAQRLLAWLQAHPETPAPLVVSVWIGRDGAISKLDFDSLGDAQADADLRTTLQAAPLPSAPPQDMRQPLRLGLALTR